MTVTMKPHPGNNKWTLFWLTVWWKDLLVWHTWTINLFIYLSNDIIKKLRDDKNTNQGHQVLMSDNFFVINANYCYLKSSARLLKIMSQSMMCPVIKWHVVQSQSTTQLSTSVVSSLTLTKTQLTVDMTIEWGAGTVLVNNWGWYISNKVG